jgi:hypothetical protein
MNEIGETLTRLANVLERLESRLDGAEAPAYASNGRHGESAIEPPPALPSTLGTRASDLRVLERGLREVLTEISRVKVETERQMAELESRASPEEQKALEQTSYMMLGNLRRRQASLLFRLQEARGEDAIDNSLCL